MGKIETDHTGSGGEITLSSDGTSLLLDGTAIGGGGGGDPDLYRDNASGATTPIATGANAFSIGTNTTASNTSSFSIGANAVSSGYQSVAVGNGTDATATNASALGVGAQATASNATAVGGARAEASYSTAIGKTSSNSGSVAAIGNAAMALNGYASGVASFAAAIDSNTSTYGAQGANSVAIGQNVKATNSTAVALGGSSNTSSGARSVTLGGEVNTASAENSYAFGVRSVADKIGQYAFGCWIGRQGGLMVLKADTTDATPKAMGSSNSAAGYNNQLILPNNSAYAFHGTIVARQKASEGTASAAWKVEGLIRREGTAGTTVLVNSATTVLDNTPAWGMALTADTTNGGLKVEVTGAAATNVRFVATIMTSEVTYA